MKSSTLLIAIMVGFLTSSMCAQETVWFDSNWKVSIKEKAAYYRPSPKKKDKGYWIVRCAQTARTDSWPCRAGAGEARWWGSKGNR